MKRLKKEIRDRWYLRWILVWSNWLFQGIIHLDVTEKLYRISFTLISSATVYYSLKLSILISLIIGHTLNWIINGSIYPILIHRLLIYKTKKKELFKYSEELRKRLLSQDWILYAASFGSICRGELKDSSDLDISIVRKPGLRNALKGLWFIIKEKKKGDISKIPLEMYLNDKPETSIKRFKAENNPVIMYDKNNIIKKYYEVQLTLNDAKKLNNIQ